MKRYDLQIFALSLILGAFLLFTHLNGAIYLWEDEARAFQLMTSGQLIYFMSRPVYAIFHTQEAVFYFVASLSFLSIALFYVLCRVLMRRDIAAFSTLVYAVCPLRIDFARTLFPGTYMELFFIGSVLCCYLGVSRRQSWWMVGGGAGMACVLFVHYMGYALMTGLVCGTVFLWFSGGNSLRPVEIFSFISKFILGFLAVFFPVTEVLRRFFQYDFYYKIRTFYADIPLYAVKHQAVDYLWRFFLRTGISFYSLSIAVVVLAAFFWTLYLSFKKRDSAYGFFLTVNFVGAGLFLFMALGGHHLIYDRHLVWLIPFLSLCVGTAVSAGMGAAYRPRRVIVGLLFAGWIAICVSESCQIVRETFSITPITAWLRQNHIEKEAVLTFWKLREPGDGAGVSLIPVGANAGVQKKDPVWHLHMKPKIMWPEVFNDYKQGSSQYIMTSGIDRIYADLGEDDPMLQHVRPLASWPHPYATSLHRSFYRFIHSGDIKLYKLSDIFSTKNFMMIKASNSRTKIA